MLLHAPGRAGGTLVALVLIPVLYAQVITGQLTGRITDTSGAVVPGVKVTVKQTHTGITRTAETNNGGYYTATLLPPGIYEILTQKSGFKATKITDIDVRVNQVNRIDATLEVGADAESIDVVADAVALETETGSLSTGVGRISLENLPLNTRDVYRPAFLSPGTVPMRAYGDDYVGTARILINGGRPMSNDYSIDGITEHHARPPARAVRHGLSLAAASSAQSSSQARTSFTAPSTSSSATARWTRTISSPTGTVSRWPASNVISSAEPSAGRSPRPSFLLLQLCGSEAARLAIPNRHCAH